ncbi:retron St85 family RNA-directed DNA polymerase [Vibrio splendidus]|uniref:retron St85 family RNA-directed DNA polymerase n=1 Tax=Vibrio splendidus TaxID=29497 RepID=UPI000CF50047|nr:retron St85 family RNA-directed DNA polymerase [Vibrio splendidus]PQJ57899.1 RNA-dependent DNA polymerase [Vibrio splendidus]
MNILNQISEKTGMPKRLCASFIITAPKRYKRYEIPKRNGRGVRLIAQPAKSVKLLQRICVESLRKSLPIHQAATAYEVGTGIKMNANRHRFNKYLLKMDFADFFPSITPEVLFNTFESHGVELSDENQYILKNLLFWKPTRDSSLELSIGAPSSPFISNAVMHEFDSKVTEFCDSLGVRYTRYADDLVFSTNTPNVLFDLPEVLGSLLSEPSLSFLRFNSDKTVFASKRNNRHITGVTLTNDGRLSIGRKRKRRLSSLIHRYKLGQLTASKDIEELKGHLGFAKHIEPIFIARMTKKYGIETIQSLQKFKSE